MTLLWMAYATLVGSLFALGAVAAEAGARLLRLPTRWAWLLVIAATLGLAARAAIEGSRHEPAPPLPVATARALADRSALRGPVLSLVGRPPQLRRRIVGMQNRTPRFAAIRGGLIVALASAALLAACEPKLPTGSEVDAMNASSAETAARRMAILRSSDTNLVYRVDGGRRERRAGARHPGRATRRTRVDTGRERSSAGVDQDQDGWRDADARTPA